MLVLVGRGWKGRRNSSGGGGFAPFPQQVGPKIPSSLNVVRNNAEFGLFILEDNSSCFLIVYNTLWEGGGGRSHLSPAPFCYQRRTLFNFLCLHSSVEQCLRPLFTDSYVKDTHIFCCDINTAVLLILCSRYVRHPSPVEGLY